jgi:hypothetical protein
LIVNARHARCGPCRSFGLLTFGPAPDRTLERDLAAVGCDLDALRVDLGAADEGVLDLLLDVARVDPGLYRDQIGDALYAADRPDGAFGPFLLKIPFDMALEREPAIFDDDLDLFGAAGQFALQRFYRVFGNLGIKALGRQLDLDLVGDRLDPETRFAAFSA